MLQYLVEPESKALRVYSSSLERLAESYLRYYTDPKSHTGRAKASDLKVFTAWLAAHKCSLPHDLTLADITPATLKTFIREKAEAGESPRTVNRRLATTAHMLASVSQIVPGYLNPALGIRGLSVPAQAPKALTQEELLRLRQTAARFVTAKEFRAFVILELLCGTGLRASEILKIKARQYLEAEGRLDRVVCKRGRVRSVVVSSELRRLLKGWLEVREAELKRRFKVLPDLNELPLLPSFYNAEPGRPESFEMSYKTLWRLMSRIAKEAGIKATAHTLRHTFATDLLELTKDVRLVAQALGHASLTSTILYTERGEDRVRDAIELRVRDYDSRRAAQTRQE